MHDPSFVYRLVIGLSIFGVLALVAAVRRPRNVARLKEGEGNIWQDDFIRQDDEDLSGFKGDDI